MSEEEEGFSLPGERKSLRNLTRGSWPGIEPLLDRAAYMRARALDVMKPFELGSSTSRHTLQFPNAAIPQKKKQELVSSRCDTTIYSHTHTHIPTHTRSRTRAHTHTCSCTHAHMHTNTQSKYSFQAVTLRHTQTSNCFIYMILYHFYY